MMAATAPVVDLDEAEQKPSKAGERQAPKSPLTIHKELLAKLLVTFTEKYPPVARLKKQIEVEELLEAIPTPPVSASSKAVPSPTEAAPKPVDLPAQHATPRPAKYFNPVLQSQLKQIDDEIAKHREERQRVSKLVANYQVKLEAIPVREQQVTELVRDYEISKGHYSQLLEKQLSAETATQLEIRQKGERFSVLDFAQPAERPSQPNRILINGVGSIGGVALGLLLALITEFLGMSITSPEQITAATGLAVLEVIPVIRTHVDKSRRKRLLVLAAATAVASVIVGCVVLMVLYHYRPQVF